MIATSSSPHGGAPVLAGAGLHPPTLCVGAPVKWRGNAWVITALHSHPMLGRFVRLEDGAGAYDLVHLNGNDGAIEALEPIA